VYECSDGVVISGNSVNVTFTSDDLGATFICKLNGKRIHSCMYKLAGFDFYLANYMYLQLQALHHYN